MPPSRPSRWRLRLTIAVAALAVPLAMVGLGAWYVASGRLAARICDAYAAVMPGRLSIGAVRLRGLRALELREVVLGEDGHRPLMTVRRLEVVLDPASLGLRAVRAEGLVGYFDAATYSLLDRIDTATGRLPPSDPPMEWDLTVVDAVAEVAEGPRITSVEVRGHVVGPLFQTMSTGIWDGRPVRVGVRSDPAGPDARRVTVTLHEAAGPLAQALDGLAAMGLLPAVPGGIKAWLPERVDAAGSVVRCDMVNPRLGGTSPPVYRAEAHVRWPGGAADARVAADQRRIQIDDLVLADPGLGTCKATAVTWDIAARRLSVLCPGSGGWRPGPRLPIPPEVPVADLLAVMPAARLVYDLADGREALELALEGRDPARDRSRLVFAWQPQGQLRIEGRELPLALFGPLVPSWLEPAGQAGELRLAVDPGAPLGDGLREVWIRFRQGRLALPGGVSLGTLDGEFALRPSGPLASAPFAASCTLLRPVEGGEAGTPLASLAFSGRLAEGVLILDLPRLDALAARVRGVRLPRLAGALRGEVVLAMADGVARFALRSLACRGVQIGAADGADLLRGLDADLRGTVEHVDGRLAGKVGGHLRRGMVAPGGLSVDLAADHPIFTLDVAVATSGERAGAVTLRELLVRAADERGAPASDRFSGQFAGAIAPGGDGELTGVVDHADLGWVVGLADRPGVKAAGEAAITCTARLREWTRLEVVGTLLPLGIDLRVGNRFRAAGVSGAVRFAIIRTEDRP